MYPHSEIKLSGFDERGGKLCVWWYFSVFASSLCQPWTGEPLVSAADISNNKLSQLCSRPLPHPLLWTLTPDLLRPDPSPVGVRRDGRAPPLTGSPAAPAPSDHRLFLFNWSGTQLTLLIVLVKRLDVQGGKLTSADKFQLQLVNFSRHFYPFLVWNDLWLVNLWEKKFDLNFFWSCYLNKPVCTAGTQEPGCKVVPLSQFPAPEVIVLEQSLKGWSSLIGQTQTSKLLHLVHSFIHTVKSGVTDRSEGCSVSESTCWWDRMMFIFAFLFNFLPWRHLTRKNHLVEPMAALEIHVGITNSQPF